MDFFRVICLLLIMVVKSNKFKRNNIMRNQVANFQICLKEWVEQSYTNPNIEYIKLMGVPGKGG